MDLPLYGRVLQRHKLVIVIGVAAAVVLALFSYYRIDANSVPPSLEPRKAEIWQSHANVFLTPLVTRRIDGQTVTVPSYSDAGRFTSAASLWARLATSDEVRRRIERQGPPFGEFLANPSVDVTAGIQSPLPIISLSGRGASPGAAKVTLTRGIDAFISYMAEQQKVAGIPKGQRVQLRVLNAPRPAVLLEPRKKTLPIVVFLAVMIASIGLAFILENASRSRQPVEAVAEPEYHPEPEPEPALERARERVPEPELEPVLEPEPEPEPAVDIRRWA